MAALTASRQEPRESTWHERKFPFKGAKKAFAGGTAVLDTADGMVKPAVSGVATLINIGIFQEDVDSTALGDGVLSVNVKLHRPVLVRWYLNDPGGGAIVAANAGADSYLLDDQTVTITVGTNSKAGRIWGVAVKDGASSVAVEAFSGSL